MFKNIYGLIALVFVAGVAVTASAGDDVNKLGEAVTSPHSGGLENTVNALPPGHANGIPADTQLVNRGDVLDVLDTDMYTYLQVTTEKGPLWLAAYKTDVAKGATVRYSNGVAMSNFSSNALKRTFDVIVFVDSLEVVK